ncbi:MAG: hypothetical protein QXN95_06330 [Candidatus Bathyarchaeia archaeon]
MRRVWLVVLIAFLFFVAASISEMDYAPGFHTSNIGTSENPFSDTTLSYYNWTTPVNYNRTAAVNYGMLIFKDYAHTKYYPSGINESVMQKNLDAFGSEDCAHFVSEALIAGGFTVLANNPPGDNLTLYLSGFPGSYGIVGAYRLADWLAGYDLPIFPANSTDEQTIGYQPIPSSYAGSPHASIFYVFNYSMFPSYFLSPGDVIVDGGAGNGHAMLYIGNGEVVQTDPHAIWNYSPAVDSNISFYGLLTYLGKNVTSLYIHIPTFVDPSVRISVLNKNQNITDNLTKVKSGEKLTFIASFPNGVGQGNYSYKWLVNGKQISSGQFFNFTPSSGNFKIEVIATGSIGSVEEAATFSVGSALGSAGMTIIYIASGFILVVGVAVSFYIRRKSKCGKV